MPGSAVIFGLGGLGGAASLTLAAAGVSRLALVDAGPVEEPDLGMSPLLEDEDLGRPRAAALSARLAASFPGLDLAPHDARLEAATATRLLEGAGVALDGAREPEAKLLAADAARRAGVPVVHGAVARTSLQLLTVTPRGAGGCLRCLVEEVAAGLPGAAELGAWGALARLGGALMAAEALRLLAGEPGAYDGRLLAFEARGARSRLVRVPRRPGCPACGASEAAGEAAPAPGEGR
ncbi:MAG TPA: ThiF family adenylyltransferase [Anaeromyxobacter sp.]|nr:ThiF family adenylyltransferase [Anaeromyxobacter sp.]